MSLHHRISAFCTRAKFAAAIISGRTLVQLTGLYNESFDGVELLHPYGYVANPAPSDTADPLLLEIGGFASHKVAIGGDDSADAVNDLQPGECGFSRGGQRVLIRVTGIEIATALLQWAATPDGPFYRLLNETAMTIFNEHTHGGGATPTPQMTATNLTGGS